jgi:hypothetical protein
MDNGKDLILLNTLGFIKTKIKVQFMQSETTSAFFDFLIVRHSHLHWRALPNAFGSLTEHTSS